MINQKQLAELQLKKEYEKLLKRHLKELNLHIKFGNYTESKKIIDNIKSLNEEYNNNFIN